MKNTTLFALCLSSFFVSVHAQKQYSPEKGYRGTVEVGYDAGLDNSEHHRVEFLTTHGLQLNNSFFIGAGTGLQVWESSDDVTIPLFLDAEALVPVSPISPYLSVRLGYVVNAKEDRFFPKNGLYFNPSVGVRWPIDQRKAVRLSVGYLLQTSDVIYLKNNYPGEFKDRINMQTISTKVAFEF